MKVWSRFTNSFKLFKKTILLVGIYLFPLYVAVYGQAVKKNSSKNQEFPFSNGLNLSLAAKDNPQHLNYPEEVKQIYRQADKKLLWIAPDTVKTHAADAMMMLDCVLQYGLNHGDYHPKELLYNKLNRYTSKFSKTTFAEKSRFDRLLTDAMLTFMNDLHYGKLNPAHHPSQIDRRVLTGFSANDELLKAIRQEDFYSAVDNVQPKSKAYVNLQYRMHLLEGRVNAECYSFPESEIRKIAINMERLRWVGKNESTFIQVNIPSLTLEFVTPDSTYKFKVIVGSPASPTHARQDTLNSFATQPAGSMIFELSNLPVMNIRGLADKQVFRKQDRAMSTGYIAVEQPDKLAALLLKYDGASQQIARLHHALNNGRREKFNLGKAVPVIITYLTLEINEGIIVSYKDIYNQDKDLEMALYNKRLPFTLISKAVCQY
jgi:murein L,D-transpeptidase YcbB/YkuD